MGTRVAGLSDRRMTPGGFTRVLSASGGCAPPGQQASVSTTQGRKGTWGTGPWPVAGLQMSPAALESRLQLRVKVTIDAPCPRSPRRIQTPCAPAVPGLVCPPSPKHWFVHRGRARVLWASVCEGGTGTAPTSIHLPGWPVPRCLFTPSHPAHWLDPSRYPCRKLGYV